MIWPKIKEIIVKGERPGSFGYMKKLNIGASIFLVIVNGLKVPKKETDLFNADEEVTKLF